MAIRLLAVLLIAGVLACGRQEHRSQNSPEPHRPSEDYIIVRDGRMISREQAEKMLGFEVHLPTFVPKGSTGPPELLIDEGADRQPELAALYFEDDSTADPVRFRLTMAKQQTLLGARSDLYKTTIKGTEAQIRVDLTRSTPLLDATWMHSNVSVLLELVLFSTSQAGMDLRTDLIEAARQILSSIE